MFMTCLVNSIVLFWKVDQYAYYFINKAGWKED